MKKSWGLTIVTLLIALAFTSGCTKKEILKEDIAPKESTAPKAAKPDAQAPEKSVWKADKSTDKRAEQDRAAKEGAKEKVVKLKAAKEAAALSAKELYELADIHFDFDKSNLQNEARTILNKHAEWLNKNKDAKLTIEGHCDERGTAEYNLALGERRAVAAADFLIDLGIDSKRMKTISYGLELPLDPRHNEEAWAKNRRVHFVVPSK